MKTVVMIAAAIASLAGVAAAQRAPQPPPQPVRVGACTDDVARRAYDVASNLWFRNMQFHGDQFQAVRDPSGLAFLLVPSADPRARYWITWDLTVVRFDASGATIPIGRCQLDPRFLDAHRPPPPPPPAPLEFDEVEYGHDAGAGAVALHVPTSVVDAGAEFLPPLLPKLGDARRCLAAAAGDRRRFYACILESSLGKHELATYRCATQAKTREAIAMCVLERSLGQNERRALADLQRCAAQHGGDWRQYPMCMAPGRFDPETVRALQCAQQAVQGGKPNYWGFATCYGGPKLLEKLRPNTEAVIALECAMTSGGEPAVFASCTGGQLAIRELDKCLQHGIGGKKGCFGDNNFFVQAHRALDQAVADAVGKQSVAYHAWQAASSMTDPVQLAKTVNNVARESGKAAENIKRELAKVAPRIKIKRIKIKLW